MTPACMKEKLSEDTPKASKKKANKCTFDNLKSLEVVVEVCKSLEAMILAKRFAVPVKLVYKTGSTLVTSETPFFDPAGSTSQKITGLVCQP